MDILANKKSNSAHTYWIIHDGKFVNNLTYLPQYPASSNTESEREHDVFTCSDYSRARYEEDEKWGSLFKTYWSRIIPDHLETRFISAIMHNDAPITEIRISTKQLISSKLLKRLCFIYDRYDVGHNALRKNVFTPSVYIQLRSKSNKIITKCNLSEINGFHFRGKIDIPDDVNEFRLEFILKLECDTQLSYSYPAVILGFSDIWLEDAGIRPYTVYNMNEDDGMPPVVPDNDNSEIIITPPPMPPMVNGIKNK